jgi:hypothetical protein
MPFNFSRHLIFLITNEIELLLTYLLDGCILSSLNLSSTPFLTYYYYFFTSICWTPVLHKLFVLVLVLVYFHQVLSPTSPVYGMIHSLRLG